MVDLENEKEKDEDGIELLMPTIYNRENVIQETLGYEPKFDEVNEHNSRLLETVKSTDKIVEFHILDVLRNENLKYENESLKKYYISGREKGHLICAELARKIEKLAEKQTLKIDLSNICATSDFVETILCHFYFQESPCREKIKGRQIVFFNPDDTTLLSIRRTFEGIGESNANCMVCYDATDKYPGRLDIVGHMETNLKELLSHIRSHKDVTTLELKEIIANGGLKNARNISSRMKELWDMGLIRRVPYVKPGNINTTFIYNTYHPYIDFIKREFNESIIFNLNYGSYIYRNHESL